MNKPTKLKLNKYKLFELGVYAQQMTAANRLSELIQSIRPQKTNHDLIRIGPDSDGGYLVPNDLQDIAVGFSPGVDTNSTFELDLLNRFGINSHLADYSVDGPASSFKPKSFIKKYLGTYNSEVFLTFDDWLEMQPEYQDNGDFLLQMDIEGAEYATLLTLKEKNLKRFRIMVIEFHDIEHWSDPAFFNIVQSTIQKLLEEFVVVHNHPNNCCSLVNMGGVIAPRVFELTFLRKDRVKTLENRDNFPDVLDRPNLSSRPDLVLPESWYEF